MQPDKAAAEKDRRAVLMEWKDPGNCVLIAASKAETLRSSKYSGC
jgi:hypothetical protein